MGFSLKTMKISGKEVLPLVEGGKGVAVSNGDSSGAWAAAGGIGTISAVNADRIDEHGQAIRTEYKGRSRKERFQELVELGIAGGIDQAKRAHDVAGGEGRIHVNVLWEMGGAERVLRGVLEGAKGLVHGVTCGAGMPFRLAALAESYGVYYYPIISSARAFRALWLRSYRKNPDFLGGVVYEDPWLAGGHNGLSNTEDPRKPEPPYERVRALREVMNSYALNDTPIVMAGGVWCLSEWSDWIDNPELGPIVFQFGTRPLLTQESPLPDAWKQRLLELKDGDISLNRFSPTGFYSSAIRNKLLIELEGRSERQVAFADQPTGDHVSPFVFGVRNRTVYLTPHDRQRAEAWIAAGYEKARQTPDSTLIFVSEADAAAIRQDQLDCMGCLSQCLFSNWADNERGTTGRKADPRSFCIQKALQEAVHGGSLDDNLLFAGHAAFRFAQDPLYANGHIPSVQELMDAIVAGR